MGVRHETGCELERRLRRRSALAGVALSLAGSATPAAVPPADTTPSGMVAFFMTEGAGCPPGWQIMTAAQGRLLLAVSDPAQVNIAVGTPLGDGQVPLHQHGFQTTVSLQPKKIGHFIFLHSLGGAGPGSYEVPNDPPGMTSPAGSGLPFIQLAVCEKS